MKTSKLALSLLILTASGLLLAGCLRSQRKISSIDPAFGKYISGYTSGMVSRKATIRIELANSPGAAAGSAADSMAVLAAMHNADSAMAMTAPNTGANTMSGNTIVVAATLPDSTLLDGAFSFEPELKGHAVWISDRVIEFIPTEPMLPNQFYNIDFSLEKFAKVESKLETFSFQLSTFAQNMAVSIDGLRTYDDYNIEWQKLTGNITTTDYEDTTTLKKVLTVTQDGRPLPVHISYNYNNNFYFYVDSIERKKKEGKLIVSWNGEPMHTPSAGSQEIRIPALGDFNVTNARIVDNEDQSVELTFSDPIEYNQNLKGIVSIQGVSDLTYAIEGNLVRVYLPNRYEGNKRVTVTTGIKNFKGYKMSAEYTSDLFFEEPKPLVRLKGNGCILPNSKGLLFPFEAISLKAVDVRIVKIFEGNVHQFLQVNNLDGESQLYRVGKVVAEKKISLDYDKKANLKQWNRHVIDLGKLITPDPGAIYRVSIKFNRSYALCNCEGSEAPTDNSNAGSGNDDWSENDWNRYSFDDGYDYWDYSDDSYSACQDEYYNGKGMSRNILASDLGLIYKLDDNKRSHAFVSNLVTAKPIPNAQVEYYDYTRQLIASGTTDNNGMLEIMLKRKPFLMLARYGKQRGYMKLLDGYANSLSKFDVEGEVVQQGVKGFIYGERGVWRPGDSLFINFMVEDKQKRLPANHPVKFELQNPSGQVIYTITKTKNLNGLYDFRTATAPEAPTGNYTALVRIGNRVFSETVKIETVKPNRLKIYLDVNTGKSKDSAGKLSAKWLHGAPAKNLSVLVDVKVSQAKTTFDKYKNYEFDSPIRSFSSNEELIHSGELDENGDTYLSTSLSTGQNAPGMLRATYITKVFEEGGDFSIDRYTIPYSPYKTYMGLHTPDIKGYDNSLETGTAYNFDLVSVNDKSEPVSANKVQVKVYKIQWRWWYEKDAEDLSQYISRSGSFVVKDTMVKTVKGRGSFRFKVNYPEYGRYLVTVTDLEGGHQTGKVVYIDWPYWSRGNRSNNENASMLNFACDKQTYTTGENIKLSFPSPADGMALVSVETGLKVVKKFWIPTRKGETTHEFPATAEMTPNAYIHVTLIQPHANTVNDLPIRMYGVVPVTVDDPATHLIPEIRMDDILKPESVTKIAVKEKKGRKMAYTLAIVDEGLLDLTRFKTPQPWSTFYAREALGVKTWDMYNEVIGAYAGKLDKLLSVGGDGDGNAGKGIKANRFKPMVKFMGPFYLEAGAEKVHTVAIPNYVGSVRVMVVAENEGAYGNAEKAVAVRKPLMILATLPRVLGPGEEVYLPVNVFAMEKHVKDVKVEVEVNGLLTNTGKSQQSMRFDRIGDEVINFKLNVAQQVGIAKVKITATSGKEKATQEIELDVRTPNPKVTDGADLVLEPGKELNAIVNYIGIPGTNKATIEFSTIPPMGLESRLTYLIQYPHGCIEQTTSSVFPQLFVMHLMDLKDKEKNEVANNIKAGIRRLQLFQTATGGFSYWPGEGYDSDWGSNYAGHFMLEAEKQGYSLPSNMKPRWIKYQQQQARNWQANNSMYTHSHGAETNQVIQAYRLYVLALSGNAEMGAMNRLREERSLSATAKWRLAAAYKLVGQEEVALALVKNLPVTVPQYKELSYSYGSDVRDRAMILETLSLLDEKMKAAPLAKEVAKGLNGNSWMSTQETAYSLLAMCEYAGVKESTSGISVAYNLNGAETKECSTKKALCRLKYSEKDFDKKAVVGLRNNGKSTLYAKVMVEGVPLTGDKTASARDLKMEVVYKDMSGNVIQPDKLQQGSDFVAEVTITNPGTKGFLKEMTLNQVFPSGWEIHNTRMDGGSQTNPARYQDIRDDRVYSYYDLPENAHKTFVIQLNATYLGKFYLPTLSSEAMYDNTINARIPGRWVEVVKDLGAVAKK